MKKILFKEADARIPGSITLQNGWDAAVEFGMLAESYHETARGRVRSLARDERFTRYGSTSQSFRAFPVIFLYRQALELALKGMIVAGEPFLDDVDRRLVYSAHSFQKLRSLVEKVFEEIGWGFDFGIKGFRSVTDFRKLLAEFDDFDASSTVCRYPVDGAGNPTLENWQCINLFEFAESIDKILKRLSDAPSIIKDRVQEYLEYLADAREAAGYYPEYDPPSYDPD